MRFGILILAWVTPAIIAGMLGWKGIWGTGSAFGDYLIPIPVAGGVFHVPSFLVAAYIILYSRNLPVSITRYLPVMAFAVFFIVQSLQLDFERINSWLFTDYSPYGSPFRFDSNPIYLFVATDALWIGIYALVKGYSTPLRYWLLLPLIPIAIIGLHAFSYQTSGPSFKMGGSMSGKARGDQLNLVYTSAIYDEKAFLDWLETKEYFARPWHSVNSEHVSIIFTNSMQVLKWRKFDEIESNNTVATFCLYEEDRALITHKGYYDCFKDRKTVEEKIKALVSREVTGLGSNIDYWYARVQLCDGVEIPEGSVSYIELFNLCSVMLNNRKRNMNKFIKLYGGDSEQIKFVRSKAESFGLVQD